MLSLFQESVGRCRNVFVMLLVIQQCRAASLEVLPRLLNPLLAIAKPQVVCVQTAGAAGGGPIRGESGF